MQQPKRSRMAEGADEDVVEKTRRLSLELAKVEEEVARLRSIVGQLKRFLRITTDNSNQRGGFLERQLLKYRDVVPAGFIDLGETFWGEKHDIHHVYNREWYQEMAPKLIDNFNNPDLLRTYIVAGNKGTGKTTFSFLLMLHALKSGLIVAYQNAKERYWIVGSNVGERDVSKIEARFTSNGYEAAMEPGVYRCPLVDVELFETLAQLYNVIYIVDVGDMFSGEIPLDGPKVIISSPNNDRLKRIGEVGHPIYAYMPLWNEDELNQLNSRLPTVQEEPNAKYVRQSEEDLKYLSEILGGVPRLLFMNESIERKLDDIMTAIRDTEIKVWSSVFSVGNYSKLPKTVPGMLVHIKQNPDKIGSCTVEFMSEYIVALAARYYYRFQRNELTAFLNACNPSRMVSAMRGYLVEEVMHSTFGSNKELRGLEIRKLGSREHFRPSHLPPLRPKTFRLLSMEDLTSINFNEYYQPMITNFPGVDAIAMMDKSWFEPDSNGIVAVGFQATVSKKKRKGVPRHQLHRVRNHLRTITNNSTLDLFLVFVTVVDGLNAKQCLGKPKQAEDDEFVQYVIRGISFESVTKLPDFTLPDVPDDDGDEGPDED